MRTKLFLFAVVLMGIFAASSVSCSGKQGSKRVKGEVVDVTMNNIMLRTEKGDTINISTMDVDPQKVPGVLLNDKVEISCVTEQVNGNDILKAVELTVIEPSGYHDK